MCAVLTLAFVTSGCGRSVLAPPQEDTTSRTVSRPDPRVAAPTATAPSRAATTAADTTAADPDADAATPTDPPPVAHHDAGASNGDAAPTAAGDPVDGGLAENAADAGFGDPLPEGLRGGGWYFEVPDGDLRERLATQPIREVKRGYGGRSVAFKITLEDGTQGYYKPEQRFSAAHWWAEVAAYHLDRALGLHRTPPVVSRRLPWATLRAAAPEDARFSEVIVGADRTVRGCFSYWVPDRLVSMRVGRGWERWVRVQTWPAGAVSPFQRPRVYMEQLAARRGGADAGAAAGAATARPGASTDDSGLAFTTDAAANERNDEGTQLAPAPARPDDPERAAELSDLLVFDYLTQNTDRWGGGNANVLTRGPGGRIVFLDNAAGFPDTPQDTNGLMEARLRVLQRFRGRTIAALRALDVAQFARRMESEPLAPILSARQLAQLETRRRTLLERVAAMEARFGDAVRLP